MDGWKFWYWFELRLLITISHQTNNQNIVKIPKQFYFLNYEFDKVNSFNSKLCLLVSNRIRLERKKAARKFRKGAKKSSFRGYCSSPGRWKLKLAVTRPFPRRNMTSVGGPNSLGPKRGRGSARRLRDPGRVVRSNCV